MSEGFTPEPVIYNLTFEGTRLDGLKLKIGSVTVREYNRMMGAGAETDAAVVMKNNDWVLELFLSRVISWNLTSSAKDPIPSTVEGIQEVERWVINDMMSAWQIALVAVPKSSSPNSSSGETSEEASLGMVPGSPNQ
jgi:hypothetical protein